VIAFLKLIRYQNLLIIAFTQYVTRWCLIYPLLKSNGIYFQLSNFHFFLLVLFTVMVAAAGYTINDYFDVNIDKINKPEKLVIGKFIKRRIAIGAHTLINFIAIIIGLYVSFVAGSWKLIFIHLFWTLGLWFYSTHFKRQFFVGNLVIALFVALVPFVVGVYDLLPIYKNIVGTTNAENLRIVGIYVLAISFFAFITTLLREIIKDIEDYDGDKEYGCKTMPIVLGKTNTKIIVVIISLFTMFCLAYLQNKQYQSQNWIALFYFFIALQIPLTFLIYKISKAQTKKDYHIAGNTAKVIMIMGVSYLFIFAYSIINYLNS